jgi:hypothetical protein
MFSVLIPAMVAYGSAPKFKIGLRRASAYDDGAKGKQVLLEGLKPAPPTPELAQRTVIVNRERLRRGSVVLTEVGVSQQDISFCLGELLDTAPSPSWG